MTALSSTELAAIRTDIAQLLPDTGHVLSVTNTSDGMGGFTETWGTATASVAYRLDPLRGREQLAGGAVDAFHTFQLTLAHSVTITTANRFKAADGTQFAVVSVDPEKSWKASTRAVVERV